MIDLRRLIGPDQFDNLLEGLVRKRYHCLLGAGASIGGFSKPPYVRPLPKGNDLANALNADFGLGMPVDHNLKAVYAELMETVGLARLPEIDAYLKNWFTQTTPPAWMKKLCKLPWARIWTLNIDDCLERTFSASTQRTRQRLISRSWTEGHLNPPADTVLAIHLHGKAQRGPSDLIFDITAYLQALAEGHRWHKIFADDYGADPFIIVGASLDSELDLHNILNSGKQDVDPYPSLIVLPRMPAYQVRAFERHGLKYVDATAEEFFESVTAAFPQYLEAMSSAEAVRIDDSAPEIEEFLSVWRELKLATNSYDRADRKHDFYSGHEPDWRDITSDLAIKRRISDDILKDVTSTPPGEAHVTVITGAPFSGKSSEVLSAAHRLVGLGYRVFLHTGEYAPDSESTLWWIEHHPKTVLILDNGRDFAMDVAQIILDGTDGIGTLRFIICDRPSGRPAIQKNISSALSKELILNERLSADERDALVAKLATRRRLGALTSMKAPEIASYFKDRDYLLFSCMADLEKGGRGFMQRLSQERAAIPALGSSRRMCDAVAAANYFGYSLPARIAHQVCREKPDNIRSLVSSGRLSDLIMSSRGGYTFRHRYIGEKVFEEFVSADEKFDLLQELALALAPHVTIEAIVRRGVEYRLARSFMSAETLARLLGSRRAYDWYERLESEYDWNARYWEQRALASAEIGAWERAYSWAMLAIDRRGKPDAYTFTTVGVVLLKRCLVMANHAFWPADLFDEAIEYLERACDIERAKAEYPVGAFFANVPPLIRRHTNADQALNYQLTALWGRWRRRYAELDQPLQGRVGRIVERAYAVWDAWQSGSR